MPVARLWDDIIIRLSCSQSGVDKLTVTSNWAFYSCICSVMHFVRRNNCMNIEKTANWRRVARIERVARDAHTLDLHYHCGARQDGQVHRIQVGGTTEVKSR